MFQTKDTLSVAHMAIRELLKTVKSSESRTGYAFSRVLLTTRLDGASQIAFTIKTSSGICLAANCVCPHHETHMHTIVSVHPAIPGVVSVSILSTAHTTEIARAVVTEATHSITLSRF